MTKKRFEQRMRETIERIARGSLGLETTETRNRDRLDFHDLHVGSVVAALELAFREGGGGDPAEPLCPCCRGPIEEGGEPLPCPACGLTLCDPCVTQGGGCRHHG